jgi:hypothetical protein
VRRSRNHSGGAGGGPGGFDVGGSVFPPMGFGGPPQQQPGPGAPQQQAYAPQAQYAQQAAQQQQYMAVQQQQQFAAQQAAQQQQYMAVQQQQAQAAAAAQQRQGMVGQKRPLNGMEPGAHMQPGMAQAQLHPGAPTDEPKPKRSRQDEMALLAKVRAGARSLGGAGARQPWAPPDLPASETQFSCPC